ncbi:MAG: UDP-N-acetylglucosamine 2-epimerase (non-hydrolyzing) [Pseudobacteriovorax sp.]|nr:UDP-N-acetylglucosamine 2-epimerase (non-hydrolyzing) [Pseudobacteriovorax sp.]
MENQNNKKIMVVVGTRADTIKMLPIYSSLKRQNGLEVLLVSTGQHQEILDDVFRTFNIQPDIRFQVMKNGQGLSELSSRIMQSFDKILERKKPDMVLVHGDTATGFAAGMSAFYRRIAVAHVEAGLRTHRLDSPFPEEFHRQTLTLMADFHFATDDSARVNLMGAGVAQEKIFVVGQSGADALRSILPSLEKHSMGVKNLGPKVLMTLHRRETGGMEMELILAAVKRSAQKVPHAQFYYPMHPNPALRALVKSSLGNLPNIHLLPSLPYDLFLGHLSTSDLVLTDSGGIQEESVLLGRRVLLVRECTERRDGLGEEWVKIIGRDPAIIEAELICALSKKRLNQVPLTVKGGTSDKITKILIEKIYA